MMSPSETELLTVDQFAERLHVSRATVFNWLQRGILVAGRHYFRFGRVIRFPWSAELIGNLLLDSAQATPQASPVRSAPKPPQSRKRNLINWDY